jgi:hypothetical protein
MRHGPKAAATSGPRRRDGAYAFPTALWNRFISSCFQQLTNIFRSFFRDDPIVAPLIGRTSVSHYETPQRWPREIETVRRWGVLTIGTGLGNAQFSNRRGDED